MISEVVMPALGATGGDVVLDAWLVEVGDWVKAGEPLFAVTTDKASVEVEAFRDGYVQELRAKPGDAVGIGAVVAILADSIDEPLEAPARVPEAPEVQEAGPGAGSGGPPAPPPPGDGKPRPAPTSRIPASPLARRIAREEGIDLTSLSGSGREGAILKRDVMQAIESQQRAALGPRVERGPLPPARREPISPMRRAIAARTQQSKAQAPHFYAAITVDMTAARALLKAAAAEAARNGWQAPTLTDLIIRAAALALRRVPQLNASYQGEEVLYYKDINIGLVVGLPDGMIVPVIHQADRKNLFALAAATRCLKERATSGELSSAELTGATFTLSNLGMFGLDSFVAVINPPEAGILALGAVAERPAVRGGRIVPRWQMTATLSVDHRVVDGISAARFMDEFRQLLEKPVRLALEPPETMA